MLVGLRGSTFASINIQTLCGPALSTKYPSKIRQIFSDTYRVESFHFNSFCSQECNINGIVYAFVTVVWNAKYDLSPIHLKQCENRDYLWGNFFAAVGPFLTVDWVDNCVLCRFSDSVFSVLPLRAFVAQMTFFVKTAAFSSFLDTCRSLHTERLHSKHNIH